MILLILLTLVPAIALAIKLYELLLKKAPFTYKTGWCFPFPDPKPIHSQDANAARRCFLAWFTHKVRRRHLTEHIRSDYLLIVAEKREAFWLWARNQDRDIVLNTLRLRTNWPER